MEPPEAGSAQEEHDPYAAPPVYNYNHTSTRPNLDPEQLRDDRHGLQSRDSVADRSRLVKKKNQKAEYPGFDTLAFLLRVEAGWWLVVMGDIDQWLDYFQRPWVPFPGICCV